jgi:hypothetical protein
MEYDGVVVGDILFFIDKKYISDKEHIHPDARVIFDKEVCTVFDLREDMGMYEVILRKNVSSYAG